MSELPIALARELAAKERYSIILLHLLQRKFYSLLERIYYYMLETRSLRNHYFPIAATLLVTPALICVAIHFSDESLKESLTLFFSSPSLLAMYTTNFVHKNDTHLLNNMLLYLIAGGLSILLYRKMALESVFMISFVATITLIPYVCSLGSLYLLPNLNSSIGFSGVTYAVYGILLSGISMWMVFEKRDEVYSSMFISFFVVYNYLALTFQRAPYPWAGYLSIVLPVIPFTILAQKYKKDKAKLKKIILSFLLISLAFTVVLDGISPYILMDGVNAVAHYLGLLFGVTIPHIVLDRIDARVFYQNQLCTSASEQMG